MDYTSEALKTTALVNCETGVILGVHCSTKQPHDTQIGWQVLTRNIDDVTTITADRGYDWVELRNRLRENGIRPLIKHRESTSLDQAHNARLEDDIYHRRSVVECTFRILKQRYGDQLRARTLYAQFRERVLKCAAKNIAAAVSPPTA